MNDQAAPIDRLMLRLGSQRFCCKDQHANSGSAEAVKIRVDTTSRSVTAPIARFSMLNTFFRSTTEKYGFLLRRRQQES